MDNLGRRLARPGVPTPEDSKLLSEILICYDEALALVMRLVRQVIRRVEQEMGLTLAITSRVKTTTTIREKLAREQSMGLKGMQDIAGLRISGDFSLRQQDQIAGIIVRQASQALPESRPPRTVDRRVSPSYGYRAVHVIAFVGLIPVEIQVRTAAQDSWAQAVEKLGDLWGRAIRYGGPPEAPEVETIPGYTRARMMEAVMALSGLAAEVEDETREAESDARELEELRASVSAMEDEPDRDDMLGRIDELRDRQRSHEERRRSMLVRYRSTLDALHQRAEEWG
jgi:ppGpp synthetase/RelA/SpoT-type nucleotidyltranferase